MSYKTAADFIREHGESKYFVGADGRLALGDAIRAMADYAGDASPLKSIRVILSLTNEIEPFGQSPCNTIDIGYADNILLVECPELPTPLPLIDTCDQGHKFAKLPGHPIRNGRARCPHCLAIGFDAAHSTAFRVSDRSGTPQAGNPAEEYSGERDPKGDAQTSIANAERKSK